jgi:hypothetical protein
MDRFNGALEEKLRRGVRLALFDWIWDELAKATPDGERYNRKFRAQYEEELEAAGAPDAQERKADCTLIRPSAH